MGATVSNDSETADEYYVYAAITDCLPAYENEEGQLLRPIKIGLTKCRCDRLKTINGGVFSNAGYEHIKTFKGTAKRKLKRILPLAGCTKWQTIALTHNKLSKDAAEQLEGMAQGALRNTYERWDRSHIENQVAKATDRSKNISRTNGLTEICLIDANLCESDETIGSLSANVAVRILFKEIAIALKNGPALSFESSSPKPCAGNVLSNISNQGISCSKLLPNCQSEVSLPVAAHRANPRIQEELTGYRRIPDDLHCPLTQ
jgi:hypothetical protein